MRELKGDWRDLFNGFMLALDLRKMFLGFAGLLLTIVVSGTLSVIFANLHPDPGGMYLPISLALHEIFAMVLSCWEIIYCGTSFHGPMWWIFVPYTLVITVAFFAIWGFFGGAIARIAAYEIAKDGERIETARAMKFAGGKFLSFFFAPVICVIGFFFFFFFNFAGGFIGKLADLAYIGGPLLAIFLPLALLSGFIMMLIVVGTLAGLPLFLPAVAAEGTDSFDAVSRGFSYVYSQPWRFLGYQLTTIVYGVVCIAFVCVFAVGMVDLGVEAGTMGFDLLNIGGPDKFDDIADSAWAVLLSRTHHTDQYKWGPSALAREPHPYGRTMALMNWVVAADFNDGKNPGLRSDKFHQVTAWIVFAWLLIVVGHAYGYAVSYFVSQQTMIYCILRKKVDGIEMNEVFEEAEDEEESLPEAPPPSPEPPEEEEKETKGKTGKSKKK